MSAFTQYHNANLKKWFGSSVSNNSLRRARASVLIGDPTLSSMYKKNVAMMMGHRIGSNMDYAYLPGVNPDGSYESVHVDPVTGKLKKIKSNEV